MKPAVKVSDVWMRFLLSRESEERFKEYVINYIRGRLHFESFWALKDISLELYQGDSLGIIGLNGAGKSTLLKLIAGIIDPTIGQVETHGVLAPLIELGGGFDSTLSVKENIFFSGAMHGFSRKQMVKRYDEIIDFAELKEFEHTPLRNLSSGMRSRLGFSVATNVNPDILILDEVLAVGDQVFREKSMSRTRQIIDGGATVLFVSHSMDQVKKICKNVLWIERGHMRKFGPAKDICDEYSASQKNTK